MKKNVIIIGTVAIVSLGIWWYVKKRKENGGMPSAEPAGAAKTDNGTKASVLPGEPNQKKTANPQSKYAIPFNKIGNRPGLPNTTILKPDQPVQIRPGDKVKVASEYSELNGTYPVTYIYNNKDVYIKFDWPGAKSDKYINKMVKGSFEKA